MLSTLFILTLIFDEFSSVTFGPNEYGQAELGLSKELREMLPIVIFKESYSINDSQWVFIFLCFFLFFLAQLQLSLSKFVNTKILTSHRFKPHIQTPRFSTTHEHLEGSYATQSKRRCIFHHNENKFIPRLEINCLLHHLLLPYETETYKPKHNEIYTRWLHETIALVAKWLEWKLGPTLQHQNGAYPA